MLCISDESLIPPVAKGINLNGDSKSPLMRRCLAVEPLILSVI